MGKYMQEYVDNAEQKSFYINVREFSNFYVVFNVKIVISEEISSCFFGHLYKMPRKVL